MSCAQSEFNDAELIELDHYGGQGKGNDRKSIGDDRKNDGVVIPWDMLTVDVTRACR